MGLFQRRLHSAQNRRKTTRSGRSFALFCAQCGQRLEITPWGARGLIRFARFLRAPRVLFQKNRRPRAPLRSSPEAGVNQGTTRRVPDGAHRTVDVRPRQNGLRSQDLASPPPRLSANVPSTPRRERFALQSPRSIRPSTEENPWCGKARVPRPRPSIAQVYGQPARPSSHSHTTRNITAITRHKCLAVHFFIQTDSSDRPSRGRFRDFSS